MEASPRRGRTRRDWVVDGLVFVFAVVVGLLIYEDAGRAPGEPQWLLVADLYCGLAVCVALWWRRRWPVQLAVVATIVSSFSETASGAGVLAIITLAIYRPLRFTMVLGGLTVVSLLVYTQVRPSSPPEAVAVVVIALLLYLGGAGWGLYVRSRRQLWQSLKDRADRAETVARLQAEQAQLRAREEIAREMHDVLGHRLSLLSVHAGALAYRPDASVEEVAGAAEVIRASAHQALQDLREVIGVLRAPVGELPQPTFADLPDLVAGSRRAGLPVDLSVEVPDRLPDHVGRTAYRIVQEGLTNALKHAPGAPVRVRVSGAPGTGLSIELRNPVAAHASAPHGRGQGLLGLAERAALVDGRLEHGRVPGGDFRLAGWLPWPA